MNSVELFLNQARLRSERMALWLPGGKALTFAELLRKSGGAQKHLRSLGLKQNDFVVVMDPLSPRLYALLIACLASGACVVFVEPWMKIERIARLLESLNPRFFVAGLKGRLWGLRVPAVRKIPHWVWPEKAIAAEGSLDPQDVPPDSPGILTFTSGTTGLPKGVVRAHGYMMAQHQVLSRNLGLEEFPSPDLCIFANFALANLASGRGSVIVPSTWKPRDLRQIQNLPRELSPSTLTAGPAFLDILLQLGGLPSLKSIHVGGALSDISLFERAFAQWPEAHLSHLYGSSEAEPVSVADGHEAVARSKERGFFQVLHLGRPVPEIKARFEEHSLWVSGDHVGPEYWGGDTPENRANKKREQGALWHNMGDRIQQDAGAWWYSGRSHQDEKLFLLDQKIYGKLGHSRAFTQSTPKGPWLFGESLRESVSTELGLAGQTQLRIFRDPRHRARIDRELSLKKGAPWALG